jgi:hypothetical protein
MLLHPNALPPPAVLTPLNSTKMSTKPQMTLGGSTSANLGITMLKYAHGYIGIESHCLGLNNPKLNDGFTLVPRKVLYYNADSSPILPWV